MSVRIGIFPSDCWLALSQELSSEEMLIYCYLWTCNHRKLQGAFKLPLLYTTADLFSLSNGDPSRIVNLFENLEAKNLIVYDGSTQEVLIRDYMSVQSQLQPSTRKESKQISEAVLRGVVNGIDELRSEKIKSEWQGEARNTPVLLSELERQGFSEWFENLTQGETRTFFEGSSNLRSGSGFGLGNGLGNGNETGMSVGHSFVCTKGDPPA
jgi:hypothetical protein